VVEGTPEQIEVAWKRIALAVREEPMALSGAGALRFKGELRRPKTETAPA
jgi:hypothetical protein